MDAYVTLRALSRDLSAAGHLREIGDALVATSAKFGVPHVLVAETLDTPIAPVFSSIADVTFEDLAAHPLVERARQSDVPFGLAEAFQNSGASAAAWSHGLPNDFSSYDGVVIPVHADRGLAWWVCFAGENPFTQLGTTCLLTVAGYAARDRALELVSSPAVRPQLTSREVACLRQAASGKSDSAIGLALGIRSRTVRFHIGNAKAKLGVRTRIQAIACIFNLK